MSIWKYVLVLALLLAAAPASSWAQVEKVAARTKGISCGDCALIAEVYLRRLQGVDKVAISKSQEAVLVVYKPGAAFDPAGIRDALARTDVDVVQFQISARGRVQEEGGKSFFIAGKDKFLVVASPKIPSGAPVLIEGIVNDRTNPMELKILAIKEPKP